MPNHIFSIWLGAELDEERIENVFNLSLANPSYNYHFCTDNIEQMRAAFAKTGFDLNRVPNLKIANVWKEIDYENLDKNGYGNIKQLIDLFSGNYDPKKINLSNFSEEKNIPVKVGDTNVWVSDQECIMLLLKKPNHAFRADLIRYLLLKKGGIYFDCDIKYKSEHQPLPYPSEINLPHGFSTNRYQGFLNQVMFNNDFLISATNNNPLSYCLNELNKKTPETIFSFLFDEIKAGHIIDVEEGLI